MSLNTMARRLSLEIPGIADSYAALLLDEALGIIEDAQLWSFQLGTSGWLTPGLLFPGGPGTSVGTVTATPNSPIITGDAAAVAVWSAYSSFPPLTQCQFRSPYYSLYSIIGFDSVHGTLTLDRPWQEPSGTSLAYMIYQAYFPVPVNDFKRFMSMRDTTNNSFMDYWTYGQKDLAVLDPERTIFNDPCYVVPFQVDQRVGSSTLGYMLYELWPHPLSVLPYTYQYARRGPRLIRPSDTVPVPLSEDLLLWLARCNAYLFKEANKGENIERGSGADFKFLAQSAEAKFTERFKPIKDRDRDLVELYFSRLVQSYPLDTDGYATQTGQVNIGQL